MKDSKKLTFNLFTDQSRCTTKKTRFVSGNQQILRVDKESNQPISSKLETKILSIIKSKIELFDVVVLSDYNKGILTDKLLKTTIELSRKKNKLVIVDPKKSDFSPYKGANIITPNFKELLEASKNKKNLKNEDDPNMVCLLYTSPSPRD